MSAAGAGDAGGRAAAPGAGAAEWRCFGPAPASLPDGADAVVAPARDGFADPPALAVRAAALAQVGGVERVRAGGLADLVARLHDAGLRVTEAAEATPPARPVTLRALLQEGSARLWLFRRWPARHPLPRPREWSWRTMVMAVGALRANGLPR